MIRRIVPVVCALLASTALIEGCTPISVYQGFQVVDSKPADLKVVKDVVFKQVGEQKLDLMLFLPLEKKFEKSPNLCQGLLQQ